MVGFTMGSRGEVPGKRKPVIRVQQQQQNNNSSRNSNKLFHSLHFKF
jgi:hypothetical protein